MENGDDERVSQRCCEDEREPLVDQGPNATVDLAEVLYASAAFWATLKPVATTLVLSTLVVIYIPSLAQSSGSSGSNSSNSVRTYGGSNDDNTQTDDSISSGGQGVAFSVLAAFLIICFICAATFVLVFFYWMKCYKCLTGYLIFSSVMLLAVLGGTMWYSALLKYGLPCDVFTFFLVLCNFAAVGIVSIFYSKGVPSWVTQWYLIATGALVAWNLSSLPEWTAWSLLIGLAFYDLCAVLTPCGPLKALVSLMQRDDSAPLPGLLYEAELDIPAVHAPPPPPPRPSTFAQSHTINSADHVQHLNGNDPLERITSLEIGESTLTVAHLQAISHRSSSISESEAGRDSQIPDRNLQLLVRPASANESLHSADELLPHELVERVSSTIKLGLGDFVFYSVLVAKAAQYGFATCVACFVVVLSGLGMTLVLLSIYRMALPALPISIFMGVLMYACVRVLVIPFFVDQLRAPYYL